MNGILADVGAEQLALVLLALLAVIAVWADLGSGAWAVWTGLAAVAFIRARWSLQTSRNSYGNSRPQ